MLKISAKVMAAMTREMFFNRLREFIGANCQNEKLRELSFDAKALPAIWLPVWDRASKLSEHDCAVFLVVLAVCDCEGIPMPAAEAMADRISEQEIRIKQFIADRGYFRFSDFDYPGGNVEGDANA